MCLIHKLTFKLVSLDKKKILKIVSISSLTYFIIGVQLLKSGIYLTLGAIREGRFIEMRGGGGAVFKRIG